MVSIAKSRLFEEFAFKKENNNLLAVDFPVELWPPITVILPTSISASSIGPKSL